MINFSIFDRVGLFGLLLQMYKSLVLSPRPGPATSNYAVLHFRERLPFVFRQNPVSAVLFVYVTIMVPAEPKEAGTKMTTVGTVLAPLETPTNRAEPMFSHRNMT